MRRRPARASGPGTRAGVLERLLFRVMGPPQLGDVSAPPAVPAEAADQRCPRCGSGWEAHERVRTSSRGYVRCPRPEPG